MKNSKFMNILGFYLMINIMIEIFGATNISASLSNLSEMGMNKKDSLLTQTLFYKKEKRKEMNPTPTKYQRILDEKLHHKNEPRKRLLTHNMVFKSSAYLYSMKFISVLSSKFIS